MIPNEHTFEKWQINKLEIQEMPSFGHTSFIKEMEELYKLPESYFILPKDIYNSIRSKDLLDSDGSVGAWANNYCSTHSNITVEKIVALAKELEDSKKAYDKTIDEIFKKIDYNKIKKYVTTHINMVTRQVKKSKRKGGAFKLPRLQRSRVKGRVAHRRMLDFISSLDIRLTPPPTPIWEKPIMLRTGMTDRYLSMINHRIILNSVF